MKTVAYQGAKRNHYNPCFWTALWNEQFFADSCTGKIGRGSSRRQQVFTLNLRSNKIFKTQTEKVHYDKGLGIAEITTASMLEFCQRRFPDKAENLRQCLAEHPDILYLDFEATLTGVENLQCYDALLRAAKRGGLESSVHKGFLACALVIHAMRSHELMTSMLGEPSPLSTEKWEYFWLLKNAWSDRLALARAVIPLALGEWTFWRTQHHHFPLPDSPVMIDHDSVFALISPRLLLKIDLTASQREDQWNIIEGIPTPELDAFQRRATANAFKDIIFSDVNALEQWQMLPEYQDRIRQLALPASRAACVREAAARVLWALKGFGRVASDFETRAGNILDREEVQQHTERIRRTW
ncbi:MAG: hypothetical protein ABI165_21980 [Bryobacteraceae bacterium]